MEHLMWEKDTSALECARARAAILKEEKRLKDAEEAVQRIQDKREYEKFKAVIESVLKEFDGINGIVYDPKHTDSLYLNEIRIAWASAMRDTNSECWIISWHAGTKPCDYRHCDDVYKFPQVFGEAMAEFF